MMLYQWLATGESCGISTGFCYWVTFLLFSLGIGDSDPQDFIYRQGGGWHMGSSKLGSLFEITVDLDGWVFYNATTLCWFFGRTGLRRARTSVMERNHPFHHGKVRNSGHFKTGRVTEWLRRQTVSNA
jgi:hypothetical protein